MSNDGDTNGNGMPYLYVSNEEVHPSVPSPSPPLLPPNPPVSSTSSSLLVRFSKEDIEEGKADEVSRCLLELPSSATYQVIFDGDIKKSLVQLKWTFSHLNMSSLLTKYRNTGQFIDLTICVEKEIILCHKLVLASCSTYFENLLTSSPMLANPHPVVLLKDMHFWQVEALVDFMYCGEVDVVEHHLNDLINAARILGVRGLMVIEKDSK